MQSLISIRMSTGELRFKDLLQKRKKHGADLHKEVRNQKYFELTTIFLVACCRGVSAAQELVNRRRMETGSVLRMVLQVGRDCKQISVQYVVRRVSDVELSICRRDGTS